MLRSPVAPPRRNWRRVGFVAAAGAVNAGIVLMLTNAAQGPAPIHRPRNIQIVYLPMPKPAPPPRATRPKPAPAAKGAITLPAFPDLAPGEGGSAARALGAYRDCDPSRMADLTPQERERCARIWAAIPNTVTDPTIDLNLRRQWTADIVEKGRIPEGPFHKCIGTQRSRLGLGCWQGLDH